MPGGWLEAHTWPTEEEQHIAESDNVRDFLHTVNDASPKILNHLLKILHCCNKHQVEVKKISS